ncbi:MAG TPA: hypothetical protein VN455_12180 [Methanotrichaceae archaeon]|nr:hypothetical protein [Methanotrichaceae archaeon]
MPSTVNAGPYTINFDLKTAMEPTFTVSTDRGNDSTRYQTNIILNNQTVAAIGITNYDDSQYSGFASTRTKALLLRALTQAGQITDSSLTKRMIDGNTAEIMSYWDPQLNQNVTMVEYWKDSNDIAGYNIPAGKTKVEILSKLTNELDNNLLNTLAIQMPAQTTASRPDMTTYPSGIVKGGRSESVTVDSKCMQNWLDVGYTPSMILSLGWCTQ